MIRSVIIATGKKESVRISPSREKCLPHDDFDILMMAANRIPVWVRPRKKI